MTDWSHLHLKGWPFQTVPDETFADIWADRTALKDDVDRLIWRWARQDKSTLHLLWADLGAGKTHTLRHIERRCRESTMRILAVYAVMPEQIKGFVDVYQAIIAALGVDELARLFDEAYPSIPEKKKAGSDLFPLIPDAAVVLQMLDGSEDQKVLAAEWLRGSRLVKRELERVHASRDLRSSNDAVAVLMGLTRVVEKSGRYDRLLVMLDECQSLGYFKPAARRDVNTGLQTWYDGCPTNMTLVMSFGSGEEKYVRHLLSPELQSRADHQGLRMDLLSKADCFEFVSDLLRAFRSPNPPSEHFPFTEKGIRSVINRVVTDAGITPRCLMKAFDALLTEFDYQFGMGKAFELDTQASLDIAARAVLDC